MKRPPAILISRELAKDAGISVDGFALRVTPDRQEQSYSDYVFWCGRLGVPAAEFETWLRLTSAISPVSFA